MKRKLKIMYSTVQPESWVYREQVVAAAPLATILARGEVYAARQCRPNQRPRQSSFPVCSLTVCVVGEVVWCSVGFL